MSAFLVAAGRIAFLVLIWAFVLVAAGVIRTDIFGQRVTAGDGAGRARLPGIPRLRGLRARRRGDQQAPAVAPPEPSVPAAHSVVVVEGRSQGTSRPLVGPMTIGRAASADLPIDDDYSSSRHAQLVPRGDGSWVVEDLDSTNGTYVNGSPIDHPTPVGPGDVVRIGRTQLRLES